MKTGEGFIDFSGYKTWYIIYGDLESSETPLLVLHGGPGYPHGYLNNLSELTKKGRAVVLYDQLGCGKSDRPDNPDMWTVELFVREVGVVRDALGLVTVDILGQSWGGSLAIEYMLTKPKGVEKLVLHSPLLSSELWVKEADRLKDQLPEWAAKTMRKHEHEGTTSSEEYLDAYVEFKNRFVCRVKPYPKILQECDREMGGQVYETMWGPSEAYATGTLKNWSVLDRLSEIDLPTLIISGKYDEATPKQMTAAHKGIKDSQWVLLEKSSHTGNLEQPEEYLAAVEEFLSLTSSS